MTTKSFMAVLFRLLRLRNKDRPIHTQACIPVLGREPVSDVEGVPSLSTPSSSQRGMESTAAESHASDGRESIRGVPVDAHDDGLHVCHVFHTLSHLGDQACRERWDL